jgi:hypothetical protein
MSEESRKKLSDSCKGRTPWNKGKECPQLSAPRGPLKNPVWNKTESNVTCAMCGKVFHKKPALVKAAKLHYCSSRCMGDHRKTIYSGANNPFYGKEHPGKGIPRTEEVCNKISEAVANHERTEEHCKNISKAKTGWVGIVGPANHFYRNTEMGRIGAKAQMKAHRSNFLTGKYIYANINMRSSWEVEYAKLLDRLDVKWEYESKQFDLGELGIYVPDFYIPAWDVYVEIKGWKSETGMTKFKKFKEMKGWRAVLIDEAKMKEIGIYKKTKMAVVI